MRAASTLKHVDIASRFLTAVEDATLEETGLQEDVVDRLRHPLQEQMTLDSSDHRLSLELFLATRTASESVYSNIRDAIQHHHPESSLLSLAQVKACLPILTGVQSIVTDMCVNSCLAYTGPFEHEKECISCHEPRYDSKRSTADKQVPRQQFHTIPIGPILQALRRNPESAKKFGYLRERMTQFLAAHARNPNHIPSVYDDFDTGSDFRTAVINKKVTPDDSVLMFSMDGAQLYRNKTSDCWIAIFMIGNFAPDLRFLKDAIFPAFTIPGPRPPMYYDSFLAPTLQHLSAIQKEGVKVFDAAQQKNILDRPFLAYAGADRMALAPISGSAGHHAKFGCRSFCPVPGRHKHGGSVYYPAFLKPDDYAVPGSSHRDLKYDGVKMSVEEIQVRCVFWSWITLYSPIYLLLIHPPRYKRHLNIVRRSNDTNYEGNRLETGLCKPSSFSGLPGANPAPSCFSNDCMHHTALNVPDLMLPLWRGKMKKHSVAEMATWPFATLSDDAAWQRHGLLIGKSAPHWPGSFDRVPRNPALKLNSGYKAWEFMLYFYGIGPAAFFDFLPHIYWRNYCLLVKIVRTMVQHRITEEQIEQCDKVW